MDNSDIEKSDIEISNVVRLESCIGYFRERSVYRRLFSRIRDKYISLGHFGGTVQLTGLSAEEKQQLGGFFQKDYTGNKTVTISAAGMEQALQKSRFAGLKWDDILREYFKEELVGKKEQKHREETLRQQYFAGLMQETPHGMGSTWLAKTLQTQGEGYRLLMQSYREKPEQLAETLKLVMAAIPQLPRLKAEGAAAPKELLAVFAAQTTGNPHFFDAGTLGEQLLTQFLKEKLPNNMPVKGFHAEEKARLFFEAGLLKDELSNNTLTYGLHAMAVNGAIHEGIEGFLNRREPLILTLRTLGGLSRVYGRTEKQVYIVENPAVFSKLIQAMPNDVILCGNGQIRLATLVLLDLFDSETVFFYAGDFDPEGLQIAQRLKERYGQRLRLWKYCRDYYEKYHSNVEIPAKSLKKLDSIYLQELLEIKKALLEKKKAAYQETMMQEYLGGI